MRTLVTKFFKFDELKSEALKEAKILFKENKEKILSKNLSEFDYTNRNSCFYGVAFGDAYNETSIAFKEKHKFPLYGEKVDSFGGKPGDDDCVLLEGDRLDKMGLTALEIVTSNDTEFGNHINLAMRFNFRYSIDDLIKKNIL